MIIEVQTGGKIPIVYINLSIIAFSPLGDCKKLS